MLAANNTELAPLSTESEQCWGELIYNYVSLVYGDVNQPKSAKLTCEGSLAVRWNLPRDEVKLAQTLALACWRWILNNASELQRLVTDDLLNEAIHGSCRHEQEFVRWDNAYLCDVNGLVRKRALQCTNICMQEAISSSCELCLAGLYINVCRVYLVVYTLMLSVYALWFTHKFCRCMFSGVERDVVSVHCLVCIWMLAVYTLWLTMCEPGFFHFEPVLDSIRLLTFDSRFDVRSFFCLSGDISDCLNLLSDGLSPHTGNSLTHIGSKLFI